MQILIVTILTVLLAFFGCIVMQHAQLYYNFVQVTYVQAQDYCYAHALLLENLAFLRSHPVLLQAEQPYVHIQGLFVVSISLVGTALCKVIVTKNDSVIMHSLYTRKSLGL